jgi:hypothetical protein
MAREVNQADSYFSRVLKYIPSEIVMVFISLEGVIRDAFAYQPDRLETSLWILAGVLTILTPVWLWRVMKVKRFSHLLLSTVALPVWMFAIGGPFATFPWYNQSLGAVALPLFTLLVPILIGGELK